jgi:NAD(P)-dependent dehydrogenase (short-subunit alcohol dehydrogenase family)
MNPKITDWPASASGWSAPRAASAPRWPANWPGAARAWRSRRAASDKAAARWPFDRRLAAALRCHRHCQPGRAPAKPARRLGGIDLVVYLAGDYVPMRADNFDLASPRKVVAVNFNAAMRLAATVLPDLRPGGGIAFVASVAGYRGLPKALAYGPGKAALIHFAECLHLDLAPQGHRRLGRSTPASSQPNSPPRTISPCPPC